MSEIANGHSFRAIVNTCVLYLIVLAIIVAANWPYQMARVIVTGRNDGIDTEIDFPVALPAEPIMAGWPYRYWIQYPRGADDAAGSGRFSLLALSLNLLVAGLCVGIIVAYSRYRGRGGNSNKLTIADLLVVAIVLAMPLGWWRGLVTKSEQKNQFVEQFRSREDGCVESAWVPTFLVDYLPDTFVEKLQKVREVRIEHPTPELLAQIVALNELQVLRLGGDTFEIATLAKIANNPHLTDLRIAGRKIDTSMVSVIDSLSNLRTLNLMYTNVNGEAIGSLKSLNKLERLNLMHTDVRLSDVESFSCSKTLRNLCLGTYPVDAQGDLKIASWPRLESLRIQDLESTASTTSLKVNLSDLPSLRKIECDNFQKFNLQIRDAPVLETLTHIQSYGSTRILKGDPVPGLLWCDQLSIDGAGKLERLEFYAPDLTSLRFSNCPNLKAAAAGTFRKNYGPHAEYLSLKPENCQALLEGLGKSDCLRSIDLIAVPLGEGDLSLLTQNRNLEELLISDTGISTDQWKSISGMKWLKKLDISGLPIDMDGVRWVLENFPEMEHLTCTPAVDYERGFLGTGLVLRLENHPNLKVLNLKGIAYGALSGVEIKGCPSLAKRLDLQYLTKLHLTNAASITGLSIQSPLPEDTQLEGFRDLTYFAAGGDRVTDDVVRSLDDCRLIRTLTLAYPAASATAMESLPISPATTTLTITGSNLTDETVGKWNASAPLKYLNLSDNAITAVAVDLLATGSAKFQTLILDRTLVQAGQLGFLTGQTDLQYLSLAEVGMSVEELDTLLKEASVVGIDLSGSLITPKHLDTLMARGQFLRWVSLRGCELDQQKVLALAQRFPSLTFDIDGVEVPTRLMAQLLGQNRIVPKDYWERDLFVRFVRENPEDNEIYRSGEMMSQSIIDINYFAQLRAATEAAANSSNQDPTEPTSVPTGGLGNWLSDMFSRPSAKTPTEKSPEKSPEKPIDELSKEPLQ